MDSLMASLSYRLCGIGIFCSVAANAVLTWRYLDRRKRLQQCGKSRANVIFFPNKVDSCIEQFTKKKGCKREDCNKSHDDINSTVELIKWLKKTKYSLDIAVFCITSEVIADAIIRLVNRKNVTVRVITDADQILQNHCQIQKLNMANIKVHLGKDQFFMHNKFAISDNSRVITGSLNWSYPGLNGNDENVFLSDNRLLVNDFCNQFTRLWKQYGSSGNEFSVKSSIENDAASGVENCAASQVDSNVANRGDSDTDSQVDTESKRASSSATSAQRHL